MEHYYHLALSFSILLSLTACGASHQLKQANDTYLQAIEVAEGLKPRLYELNQHKNSLNVQGRALLPEEIDFIRAVETIEAAYHDWKESEMKPSDAAAHPGARRLANRQKAWLAEIQSIRQQVTALLPPN